MTSSHRPALVSIATAASLVFCTLSPIASADDTGSADGAPFGSSSSSAGSSDSRDNVPNKPADSDKTDNTATAETEPVFDPSLTETERLTQALEKKVASARAALATKMAKAVKMRDEWGYDAAFEAVNRLNEVKQAADDIDHLLVSAKNGGPQADNDLRHARALALYLDSKMSDADYDISLAEQIHSGTVKEAFKCSNAIDDGDTSGSSWSSSTLGLFNSTGNRIVYDDDGRPQCTTNFEFYFKKMVKFITTVLSIVSFLATVTRLVSPGK